MSIPSPKAASPSPSSVWRAMNVQYDNRTAKGQRGSSSPEGSRKQLSGRCHVVDAVDQRHVDPLGNQFGGAPPTTRIANETSSSPHQQQQQKRNTSAHHPKNRPFRDYLTKKSALRLLRRGQRFTMIDDEDEAYDVFVCLSACHRRIILGDGASAAACREVSEGQQLSEAQTEEMSILEVPTEALVVVDAVAVAGVPALHLETYEEDSFSLLLPGPEGGEQTALVRQWAAQLQRLVHTSCQRGERHMVGHTFAAGTRSPRNEQRSNQPAATAAAAAADTSNNNGLHSLRRDYDLLWDEVRSLRDLVEVKNDLIQQLMTAHSQSTTGVSGLGNSTREEEGPVAAARSPMSVGSASGREDGGVHVAIRPNTAATMQRGRKVKQPEREVPIEAAVAAAEYAADRPASRGPPATELQTTVDPRDLTVQQQQWYSEIHGEGDDDEEEEEEDNSSM